MLELQDNFRLSECCTALVVEFCLFVPSTSGYNGTYRKLIFDVWVDYESCYTNRDSYVNRLNRIFFSPPLNIIGYIGLGTPQCWHNTNPTESSSLSLWDSKIHFPTSWRESEKKWDSFLKDREKFTCHTALQGSSTIHPFLLFLDLLPQCSKSLRHILFQLQ